MPKKKTISPKKRTAKSKKKARSPFAFWLNLVGLMAVVAALFYVIIFVINLQPSTRSNQEIQTDNRAQQITPQQRSTPDPVEQIEVKEEDLVLEFIKRLSDQISVDTDKIRVEKKDNDVKMFIPLPTQNEDLYFCNMFYKGRMEKNGFSLVNGVETYFYIKRVKINAQKLIFNKKGLTNQYSLVLYVNNDTTKKVNIAIVVNFDKNVNMAMINKLLGMSKNLHPAFLPEKKIAHTYYSRVNSAGFPCIIRVPMEPIGKYPYKAGKNSILVSDTERKVTARMKKFSSLFPNSVGVSNYMGSHVTAKRLIMEPIMEFLSKKEMLFLDNRTTKKSCAEQVATDKNVLFFHKDNTLDSKITNTTKRLKLIDALSKSKVRFIVYDYTVKTLQDLENLDSFVKLVQTNGFPLRQLTELRTLQQPKL